MDVVNTVKPARGAKAQAVTPEMNFASKSVPRHLTRGAIGFGLIIGSIAWCPSPARPPCWRSRWP